MFKDKKKNGKEKHFFLSEMKCFFNSFRKKNAKTNNVLCFLIVLNTSCLYNKKISAYYYLSLFLYKNDIKFIFHKMKYYLNSKKQTSFN